MATKKETVTELLIQKPVNEKVKEEIILEQENKILKEQLFSIKEELEIKDKEIKSLKKSNEEIIANEHNIKKLLEKAEAVIVGLKEKEKEMFFLKEANEEMLINENNLKELVKKTENEILAITKTLDIRNKQIEDLKNDLSKLANLFDEYIVAYQDQVKMLGVFVKNTQTVEKYLSIKIDEYNGGIKKWLLNDGGRLV